jgi:hypothetical protein
VLGDALSGRVIFVYALAIEDGDAVGVQVANALEDWLGYGERYAIEQRHGKRHVFHHRLRRLLAVADAFNEP